MLKYSFRSLFEYAGIIGFAAALGLAGASCSEETGIVIQVERGTLTGDVQIARLDFYIGVAKELAVEVSRIPQCSGGADGQQWFVDSTKEADRTVDVGARDLAADPYRLLLRPGEELSEDVPLFVVAVAWMGQDIAGVAELPSAVTFEPGNLLQWGIELAPPNDSFGAGNGCVCTAAGAIVTPGDHDCDAASAPEDCNDGNGQITPNSPERCDGIDSNCNPGDRFEGTTRCYVASEGSCFLGRRECDDEAGNLEEALGVCQSDQRLLDRVPVELCQSFARCPLGGDQFECATAGKLDTLSCEVLVDKDDNLCSGRNVVLGDARPEAACSWTIVGGFTQEHYGVAMFPNSDDLTPADTVNACQPIFRLVESLGSDGSGAHDDSFLILYEEGDAGQYELIQLAVHVNLVEICPVDSAAKPGFTCDGLENIELLNPPAGG